MNRGPGSFSGCCSFPVWRAGEWAERCFKRSCDVFINRQFTVVTSGFLSNSVGNTWCPDGLRYFCTALLCQQLAFQELLYVKPGMGLVEMGLVEINGAKSGKFNIVLALLDVNSHHIQPWKMTSVIAPHICNADRYPQLTHQGRDQDQLGQPSFSAPNPGDSNCCSFLCHGFHAHPTRRKPVTLPSQAE